MTTIFDVLAVETVLRILGIVDAVPRAPFAPLDLECLQRLQSKECIALLCKFQEASARRECEGISVFLVVLLRVLLITDHVLLIALIRTADAVSARVTVPEEETIGTILTVLREEECVAMRTVDAFVTPFTLVTHGTINGITGLLQEIAVVTILAVIALTDQITILEVPRRIIEVAILHRAWRIEERHVWHDIEKVLELWEERTRKINISPIRHAIPAITNPCIDTVDGEGLICVVLRDDLRTCEITFPIIQTSRIALTEPALQSTIWTVFRSRDFEKIEEAIVILRHIKWCRTLGTNFLHT